MSSNSGGPAGQRRETPHESSQSRMPRRPVIGPAVNGSQANATTQTWTQSRPSVFTAAGQLAWAGAADAGFAPESAAQPGPSGARPSGPPSARPARRTDAS